MSSRGRFTRFFSPIVRTWYDLLRGLLPPSGRGEAKFGAFLPDIRGQILPARFRDFGEMSEVL